MIKTVKPETLEHFRCPKCWTYDVKMKYELWDEEEPHLEMMYINCARCSWSDMVRLETENVQEQETSKPFS